MKSQKRLRLRIPSAEAKCCDFDAPHRHLVVDGLDFGPLCIPAVGFDHPPWCKETRDNYREWKLSENG